ncbi:MAG: heparin lyase I family protein [Actinomycetota bacterium]
MGVLVAKRMFRQRLPLWTAVLPIVIATAAVTAFFSSSSSAAISWRGDYETQDWTQWGAYNVQLTSGASAVIERDTVRQGRYAARFSTPPFKASGERSRAQIYLNAGPSYGNPGQENWFSWSTMIAPGSVLANGGWNNLTAFHHANIQNPCPAPDHFAVTNRDGSWMLRLDSWGGRVNFSTCDNPYRKTWNLKRIQAGKWYDIMFHVKWSSDPRVGFVEVWINGRQVLPLVHAATLYDGDRVYLKQGYDGSGASGTTTIYNDSAVIAGNRAGAVAAFR